MEFELAENTLTARDLNALRLSAGWPAFSEEQAELCLKNSQCTVSAIKDGRIIGIGRLVGDGVTIWYVQDLIVLPEYQGAGVGRSILERLIARATKNSLPSTAITLGLMAARDKEGFYQKFGFRTRPNQNEGAGMVMNIKTGEGQA